ncbi:MAG TPA: hypothetical protein VFL75_06725 [Candidatus Limnocylindria bacterium]|nr:hypothetical protein [Candidatus Limnocylindria bacterium]
MASTMRGRVGMSTDQGASRTDGETHGQSQEPVNAGERDATQREQAQNEGRAPIADPAAPDADREDSLATSPDATYGQAEGQAGTGSAGMPLPNAKQGEQ